MNRPPEYTDFVLIIQGMVVDGCRTVWFQSAKPITWPEARDRIIRDGHTAGFPGAGWGKGQWMLSVDPADIDLQRRNNRQPVPL